MPRLSKVVKDHLDKARSSAICAVEVYNKPGLAFRTRNFVILMVIAYSSLFHAVFHRRGTKPWYRKSGEGRGTRYDKVDGEPKHWDLPKCADEFFKDRNPPERENLKFMAALRNKIEHRNIPELDPALYGECQAMLMNFEDFLVGEFGNQYALAGNLAVALQFSRLRPDEQQAALRALTTSEVQSVLDYVQRFRAGLTPEALASSRYSFSVFLIPKIVSRENAADLSVEFIKVDPDDPEQLRRLQRWNAFIKERVIPVASGDLIRATEVVQRLERCLPFTVNMHVHTMAWRYYDVRPSPGADRPERTRDEFCRYDSLANTYGYKEAWVRYLCRKLADREGFERVVGRPPVRS